MFCGVPVVEVADHNQVPHRPAPPLPQKFISTAECGDICAELCELSFEQLELDGVVINESDSRRLHRHRTGAITACLTAHQCSRVRQEVPALLLDLVKSRKLDHSRIDHPS